MFRKQDLAEVLSGEYSYESFNKFFTFCQSYVRTVLRNSPFIKSIPTLCEVYDLNEVSTSIIAPLFARNEYGKFVWLLKYFDKLDKNVVEMSEGEATALTKTLLRSCYNQNILDVLAEDAPFYTKIYHNVVRCIHKSEKLKLKKGMIGLTESVKDSAHIQEYSKKIDLEGDYFRLQFQSLAKSTDSTMKHVENLITILNNLDNAVPLALSDFIGWIFELRSASLNEMLKESSCLDLSELDIKLAVSSTRNWIKCFLDQKYVSKSKLTPYEAGFFEKAVDDYLSDVLNGNSLEKLYYYLHNNDGGMSFEEYNNNYRHKFEYLVLLSREKLLFNLK